MKSIHPSRILYEDEHLLVVQKLAGELSVAAPGPTDKLPLFDMLKRSYPGLTVVHRLDFNTSGVLVFAKDAKTLRAIRDSRFAGWIKTYRLLVSKPMQEKKGVIDKALPARTDNERVPAVTQYTVLRTFPRASYVEAQIETGRKHQIRRHFQMIGHPLLLDPLYGDPRVDRAFKRAHRYRRFFLHALRLSFPHPIGGQIITVTAPLPPAFQRVLDELSQPDGRR